MGFSCKTCKYDNKEWWEEPCDGCTVGGGTNHYEPIDDMGEVSDGYHTFNQLYYQRAVLFATIVNQNKDKSWKSFKHSDGNYCFDSNGEWFIVGIDTPQGNYTYHYAKEYWDMFDCEELECGKEWDGHTEEDVTRLLSLVQEPMRDATPEERESVDKYVKSISKPTGVNFEVLLGQKSKWIPVSERLPEVSDYCLCCDNDGYITIGFISKYSKKWCFDDDEVAMDVLAWMPLPEPYKPESEEEEE